MSEANIRPTYDERVSDSTMFGDSARRSTAPLDDLDAQIVAQLQQDGRMSYREIGRRLGVSEGTVRSRANRMLSSGALTVVAIADPFQLGYRVLAFMLLRVVPERQQQVVDALCRWEEITYVSSCTGRADLYAQVVCRDHDHLWSLLYERIPAVGGIESTETFMELRMHKVSYDYPGAGTLGYGESREV